MTFNKYIKASELKLADTVRTTEGDVPWACGTIVQVSSNTVRIFRVYGITADFSYTGGVIPYIGVEEYDINKDDTEYFVFSRKKLK